MCSPILSRLMSVLLLFYAWNIHDELGHQSHRLISATCNFTYIGPTISTRLRMFHLMILLDKLKLGFTAI